MSERKHNLAHGNIYHVYNRGVEKRDVFSNNRDYLRFIKGLAAFNDSNLVFNFEKRFQDIFNGSHERKSLVDILAFCLMPNHYHLLLKQKAEHGITEFMRKLAGGYTNYFNLKNNRVGPLFQGKFKSVLIKQDSQYLYIPHYIHLNPLDLIYPNWRKNGINSNNKKQAINFLRKYEWSSYSDYAGSDNYGVVLNKNLIIERFAEDGYDKDFTDFIKDLDLGEISDILLE